MARQSTGEVLRIGLTDDEIDRIEEKGSLTIETHFGTMEFGTTLGHESEEEMTPVVMDDSIGRLRNGKILTWDNIPGDGVTLEVTSARRRSYLFDKEAPVVEEQQSFEEYLDEEVFGEGSYVYEEPFGPIEDIRVAEFPDGSGFIMSSDLSRAVEDENVSLHTIDNGWLYLIDER